MLCPEKLCLIHSDSEQFVTDLQVIHDQQTVRSFNNSPSESFLQVGFVVLRLVGFGVFTMVGFDPAKAQVGIIAIKVTTIDVCLR